MPNSVARRPHGAGRRSVRRVPASVRCILLGLLTLLLVGAGSGLLVGPTPARADPRPGAVGGPRLGSPLPVANRAPGLAPVPPVAAASYVVVDLDSGGVLAAKDAHGQYLPASTIKILTALTALPLVDPAAPVVINDQDLPSEANATAVYLVPGATYTMDQMLTWMLVGSANDATNVVARVAGGGDTERFVQLMRDTAHRLRADDTVVGSVNGLDGAFPDMRSSAYDLALVARAGLARPDFSRYVATRTAEVTNPPGPGTPGGTFQIQSGNKLLPTYPGMIGVKNGYTVAAQRTYVGAARRGPDAVLVVTMRAAPETDHADAAALLDWGFAAEAAGVRPVGRMVAPLPGPVDALGTPVAPGTVAPAAPAPRPAEQLAPPDQAGRGPAPTVAAPAAGTDLADVRGRRAPGPRWVATWWVLGGGGLGVMLLAGASGAAVRRRRRGRSAPDLSELARRLSSTA